MSSPIAHDGAFTVTSRDIAMYRNRSLAKKFDLKGAVKDCVKGFLIVVFFVALILGWQIALAQPTCTHDYKTNLTTCN